MHMVLLMHTQESSVFVAQSGDVEGIMALQKEFTDSGMNPPKNFSSVLTKHLRRLGVNSQPKGLLDFDGF